VFELELIDYLTHSSSSSSSIVWMIIVRMRDDTQRELSLHLHCMVGISFSPGMPQFITFFFCDSLLLNVSLLSSS
jgi:hypothetical protein